ncbi:MAG: CAP domain-containing protein [Planctomycetes bacterium]|nr:CAP domain-containing protein [Planctomycetota bacterium]
MIPTRRLPLLLGLLGLLLLRPAAAQDPFAAEELDLAKKCASTLLSFANTAKSSKVGQRAKQAYDLVLAYDPDNGAARSELQFKKDKGQWLEEQDPKKKKKWADKATYEARFKIMDEWYKTSMRLGALHRDLGLKMKAAGNGRAIYHLEKAVYYNAMDKAANEALGYKPGPGFYGTEEQLAMAARMKEIEMKAVAIARKDYPVQALPLEQMPEELRNLQDQAPDWMKKPNIDIFGAKSEHFTAWSRGRQDDADDTVKWAERGLEFCVYLLGEPNAKKLHFVERATRTFAWFGNLFTVREREQFLKANPKTWEGQKSVEEAMRFANTTWRAKDGLAVVKVGPAPKYVHDSMIAYVLFQGLLQERNQGMGQGLVHAVTWYLKATSISRWGALPEGTQGDDALELPEATNWWLRAVRDQAVSNQDWAFAQVPRERLSRFRNDCRLKAWSFTTWLLAAYPDQWLQFLLALPGGEARVPTLEEVEAIVVKELGKPSAAIDAEWREWARGDSGVAFGTGYGPPLLPERPSKEELAAVERINQVRAQPFAFSWPKGAQPMDGSFSGLPPCDLDAEASLGCEAHAKYICAHPELTREQVHKIHEQDPAHPDFTRRGQLAAAGNIITGTGARGAEFARDSIDMWIAAPYHRFPMLEHNIKRIGYAWVFEQEILASVLDMGSLEEPYDPEAAPKLLAWPPHGMKDVPTHFGDPEHPNPLADQPEDQQDITKCGYPISLQLQREVARVLSESSIQLFESRKGGKVPAKNACTKSSDELRGWVERCKPEEVPIWCHTPKVPLNKKLDLRDVIFAIPKEPLEPGKQYQVRVLLHIGPDPFWFVWEFTTGSQREGLRIK